MSVTALYLSSLVLCACFVCARAQLRAGPFEESQIATMLKEILKGLDYLHSEKKIHRDIKGMIKCNLLIRQHYTSQNATQTYLPLDLS